MIDDSEVRVGSLTTRWERAWRRGATSAEQLETAAGPCCDLAVTSVGSAQDESTRALIIKPAIVNRDSLATSASWLLLLQGGG